MTSLFSHSASSPSSTFTAPLSPLAHQLAKRCSEAHRNPQKVKQVYLNTLAMSAVEFYLRCMGIETQSLSDDCCDPVVQMMLDVADLKLPGRGVLDCRPVLPNASILTIPPEAQTDRLATVAVQFSDALQQATLLGFVPAGAAEVALAELRSLDALIDHITQPTISHRTSLSQWLNDGFAAGWQSLSTLTGFAQPRLATALRTTESLHQQTTRRAKLIDLGIQLGAESVALLVAITPLQSTATSKEKETDTNPRLEVWVQLHPIGQTRFLPSDIHLSQLSPTGDILQAATSRLQDNYIQLKRFRGFPGECFDIKVAFGDTCTTEAFVI